MAAASRGRHDAHTQTADHRRGHPGQDVAGSEVQDPPGARVGEPGHRLHPIDRLHQDRVGHRARQCDVEAHRPGPPRRDVHPVRQTRRMEADLHRHRVEHG